MILRFPKTGADSFPAMNDPPTMVMNPALTVMSLSVGNTIVADWLAMPMRSGVS